MILVICTYGIMVTKITKNKSIGILQLAASFFNNPKINLFEIDSYYLMNHQKRNCLFFIVNLMECIFINFVGIGERSFIFMYSFR